jgi:hypothetical protein
MVDLTRRNAIAGIGGLTTVALAGCAGDDEASEDNASDDVADENGDDGAAEDANSDDEPADGANGDNESTDDANGDDSENGNDDSDEDGQLPTLHAFGVLRVGLVRELGLKPIGVGGKSDVRLQRSRL